MKPIKLLYLALLSFPILLNAQKLEVSLAVGATGYLGDLNKSDFVLLNELNPTFGVSAKYNLSQIFGVTANYSNGKITGDDANFEERANMSNPLNFDSPYHQLAFNFEWTPLKPESLKLFDENGDEYFPENDEDETVIYDKNGTEVKFQEGYFVGIDADSKTWVYNKSGEYTVFNQNGLIEKEYFPKRFSPYLFAGFGVANFSPNEDNGLPSDAPEVLNGIPSLFMVVPFGGGLRYDLNRKFGIALEGSYQYSFSDEIDGISASRDPLDNDWYLTGGIRIIYKLASKKDFIF